MPSKNTEERHIIVQGLLKRIRYELEHDSPNQDDKLLHLENILQKTLEKFIDEDVWDDFYKFLENL